MGYYEIRYTNLGELNNIISDIKKSLDPEEENWDNDNQIFKFKKPNFSIQFPEEVEVPGKVTVKGSKTTVNKIKELHDKTRKVDQEELEESKFFKGIDIGSFNTVFTERLTILQLEELEERLEKLNIKKVDFSNPVSLMAKELTIGFGTYFNEAYDNHFINHPSTMGFCNDSVTIPNKFKGSEETISLLNGEEKFFGYYIKPINRIQLPTQVKDFKLVLDLLESQDVEFEEVDYHEGMIKMLIAGLCKKYHDQKYSLKRAINDKHSTVSNLQRDIGRLMRDIRDNAKELEALQNFNPIDPDEIYEKLEECKTLKFVEDTEISENGLTIIFKPSFIKGKYNSKSFYSYLGRIKFHYDGENIFTTSDLKEKYGLLVHPHSNDTRPCLGDGTTAANKIYELYSNVELKDVAYLLWTWVKTWRPDDCYHKPAEFLANRVANGVPTFDVSGNSIGCDHDMMEELDTIPKLSGTIITKIKKDLRALKLIK